MEELDKKRENKIIITSLNYILYNVILFVVKIIIGITSKSIIVIIDAVNNITDTLAAIITIIGTKLSNKAPDMEHPYGHG